MPRTINVQSDQSTTTPDQAAPTWKQTLPLDMPCQVYPRVSTPAQKKNTSAEMQNDKKFAISCGWSEEMVILDDRDLGLSGQLRMEDRPTFNEMNRRAVNGEIKAIVVSNVDRLFRDHWGIEYSKFMQMCATYGVLVITPEFVFDFAIEWHIERFRRRCEEAYSYITHTVKGRMIPARDSLMSRGFWAAGNIAVGYTVDRTLKHRKYFPYPPHAEKIVEVFELFRACGGVLSETYRRLESMHFLFPPFDVSIAEELRGRIALTAVQDEEGKIVGYKFCSLSGLASVLSNPVYIGCWLYKGVLTRDNHPAILKDPDVFFYAYNLLSPVTLQGEINPYKKKDGYIKQPHLDGRVLLKGIIVSGDDPTYKIYPNRYLSTDTQRVGEMLYTYRVCADTGSGTTRGLISYEADKIDALVVGKLVEMLLDTEDYLQYTDNRVSDADAHLQEIKRIKGDIAHTQAAMQRNIKILLSGTITAEDMLDALNTTQTALGQEVKRLEAQLETVEARGSRSSRRISYYELIHKIGLHWRNLDAGMIADMLSLFIDRVVLTRVSTCLYTLDIVWADEAWQQVTALCLRDSQKSSLWSTQEDAVLRACYPTAPIQEIMRQLPNRALNTIRRRASLKGIERCVRGERPEAYSLTYSDLRELEKRGIPLSRCTETRVKEGKPRRVHADNLVSWLISPLQFSRVRPFDLEHVIKRLTSILAA